MPPRFVSERRNETLRPCPRLMDGLLRSLWKRKTGWGRRPSRIRMHTAATFHDQTAVVRQAGASLLAGRGGVHRKG